VTETNVHEETKRVEGDRAVGRRSSGLERQRRWASSPNLGKEGERESGLVEGERCKSGIKQICEQRRGANCGNYQTVPSA
jgi:hypothetical protein